MCKHQTFAAALLVFAVSCATNIVADSSDVRLSIRYERSDEEVISRENLVKIKQFILQRGRRETYSNMYNNNPAHTTKGFHFFLNPDSGQNNINCDPEKSDFHNLTIRRSNGGRDLYRAVDFLDEHQVDISIGHPADDLTVSQIRQFVVDALTEILVEIENERPGKSGTHPGK